MSLKCAVRIHLGRWRLDRRDGCFLHGPPPSCSALLQNHAVHQSCDITETPHDGKVVTRSKTARQFMQKSQGSKTCTGMLMPRNWGAPALEVAPADQLPDRWVQGQSQSPAAESAPPGRSGQSPSVPPDCRPTCHTRKATASWPEPPGRHMRPIIDMQEICTSKQPATAQASNQHWHGRPWCTVPGACLHTRRLTI